MHHSPAGPPLAARLAAAGTRFRLRSAAALRRGRGRLALGLVLALAVTGLLLAAPVVSGQAQPDVALDASSSASPSSSPVVMGIDGRPTSGNFASASASVTVTPEGTRTEASGRGPANPATGAGTPTAPVPPAPEAAPPSSETPAPAPAEEPTPVAEEPAPAAEREASAAPAPAPAPAPAASVPAAAAPAAPAGGSREDQVLTLVNQERAAVGCKALVADAGLARVAAAHSADMRDRGFFSHDNLSGQDPFDRASAAGVSARAENIAQGQRDAAAVMGAWMDSSGHRANILDCSLTRLGVGVADGGGGPWWTQLFG